MWLSAAVKAGNAVFRIESYGIFVSQILGTFLFLLNKTERGAKLSLILSEFLQTQIWYYFLH